MSQRADGDSTRRYPVSSLCGLFGLSRQGYYKHSYRDEELDVLISSVVHYCHHIREQLPHSGCRQLYHLCGEFFGDKFVLGRDRFFDILRSNGLMLKRKRYRPHTTNSNHPFRIYDDLLNTYPKYIPQTHCRLLVADITYVPIDGGFAYLSLLTDGYSRAIVGYALHPTLSSEGPLKALQMALDFYRDRGIDIEGVIHHSDRGIQYASKEYTKKLLDNHDIGMFYDEVLRALWGYVGDKVNMSQESLNKENIEHALSSRNVPAEYIQQFIKALNDCEFARFAPGDTNANMENLYNSAIDAISKMEDNL